MDSAVVAEGDLLSLGIFKILSYKLGWCLHVIMIKRWDIFCRGLLFFLAKNVEVNVY